MNPTLRLLDSRCSTRGYDPTPLTTAEKDAILHATFRAPTAGNMMLYSIIEIADPALKDRLAVTCDDQPFIAKAPWVLVFLADFQRWADLFDYSGVDSLEGVDHRRALGPGDLMLACSDALIAAQNAVVAAESLGIGSCYIGDILEQGEEHARLLDLPPHVFPIAMLCFGHPGAEPRRVERHAKHVVHTNTYRRMSENDLAELSVELQAAYAPHGFRQGIENYGQEMYRRKFASDFMAEMNRSVAWWLERWQGAGA